VYRLADRCLVVSEDHRIVAEGIPEALRARAAAGEPKASLAREFGISRQTLYEYLRRATSAPSAGPG
jgi:DNA invertase Pin-like site-specific DNA recombinase